MRTGKRLPSWTAPAALAVVLAAAATSVVAASTCVMVKITVDPTAVCMPSGGALSDPVNLHAIESGKPEFVSWGGDTGVNDEYSGPQGERLRTQYDSPGMKTVEAYCAFSGSNKSVQVAVLKLKFQDDMGGDAPEPFKVGIGTKTAKRTKTVKAVLEPAIPAYVKRLAAKVSVGASRLRIVKTTKTATGLELEITGRGKRGSEAPGDAEIEVRMTGRSSRSCKWKLPVTVLRPAQVAAGSTQGPQYVKNLLVDAMSTPSWSGRLKANQVVRITFIGKDVTVPVRDQFGDAVGELYEGAPVTEKFKTGRPIAINRTLRGSSDYVDPTGASYWDNYPRAPAAVPRGSDAANEHSFFAGDHYPPQSGTTPASSFTVVVDGFELTPQITRTTTVEVYPVAKLTIEQTP